MGKNKQRDLAKTHTWWTHPIGQTKMVAFDPKIRFYANLLAKKDIGASFNGDRSFVS